MRARLAAVAAVVAVVAFVAAPRAARAAPGEDYRRGVAAMEQQNWPLAVRYLESAREAAPRDPALLYALGAAHARVGGHEIAALVYLHAAGRGAKGARLGNAITDLEVKLDGRVDAMLEAAVDAEAQLAASDREATVPAIVEAAARAWRPEIARRAASLSPRGVGTTAAVAKVAVERARAGRTVDAARLFGLARELAAHDVFAREGYAVAAIPLQVPRSADPAERAAAEAKHRAESEAALEKQRAAHLATDTVVCTGLNWMYLALVEDIAGFHALAKTDFSAGRDRYAGNASSMPYGDSPFVALTGGAKVHCVGAMCEVSGRQRPAGGADPAASDGAPRIPWLSLALGEGPINPRDATLGDLATALDLVAARAEGTDAPQRLATLAARVGEAAWFLQKNRP